MIDTRTEEKLLSLLKTPASPDLGPGPRPGVLNPESLHTQMSPIIKAGNLPSARRDLIQALVLLWHDNLDASHRISQQIQNPDGSYVHGIMHRREPDYDNAKYWFHRVRAHPCFDVLSKKAGRFLPPEESSLAAQLLPGGRWDSFAFVDACESVSDRPEADRQRAMLVSIQALEFRVLLEHFCS